MHTGDLCFFTGASLFIVGVVGYFFTGPNNKGVYLLIDWPPESPDNQYHLNK